MPTIDEMRVVLDADTAGLSAGMEKAEKGVQKFESAAGQSLAKFDANVAKSASRASKLAAALFSEQSRMRQAKVKDLFDDNVIRLNHDAQSVAQQISRIFAEFKEKASTGIGGAIVGAFDGILDLLMLLGDKIPVTTDGVVRLNHVFLATKQVVGEVWTSMVRGAGQVFNETMGLLQSSIASGGDGFEALAIRARDSFNSIGLATIEAAKAIYAAFAAVPAAVAEFFISMANSVISIVERTVNGVGSLLGRISGYKIEPEVNLGRMTNPLEGSGEAARKAFGEAGTALGLDFVKGFLTSNDGLLSRIAKRARELATPKPEETEPQQAAGASGPTDKELRAVQTALDKLDELHKRAQEAAGRFVEGVQVEYEKELRNFQFLLDRKLISQEQFDQARMNLAVVMAKKMDEATEKEFKKMREATDAVANAMGSAFDTFMRTGKFSFSDFARSIIADLAKIAFKMAIIQPLFGKPGEGFGALGGALQSLFGSFSFGGARASGGPVDAGRAYLVGEKGPELFVPRMSGGIVPSGMVPAMAGGGGSSVNIAFNVTSPDAEGFRQSQGQIAAMLSRAVGRGQRNL